MELLRMSSCLTMNEWSVLKTTHQRNGSKLNQIKNLERRAKIKLFVVFFRSESMTFSPWLSPALIKNLRHKQVQTRGILTFFIFDFNSLNIF